MNNVVNHPELEKLQEHMERLKSGGGGGTFNPMEARVTRLEGKLDKVEDRLASIEATLARIDAKLDSKIDYKWLTVYVLGIVAVIMRNEIAAWLSGSAIP